MTTLAIVLGILAVLYIVVGLVAAALFGTPVFGGKKK